MVRKTSSRGFTIVELLVVIIVIGIIASIAVFGFARIQAGARDDDRRASALTIMAALEKYYDENGEYPNASTLNTSQQARLANYNAVIAAMPGVTIDTLTSAGDYNFYPVYCQTSSCNDTQLAGRSKQFMYVSSRPNDESVYTYPSTNNLWGCQITFSADSVVGSAAVLAWRAEDTGKWTFLRTKNSQKTPSNHPTITNSGVPVVPTTCEFTTA